MFHFIFSHPGRWQVIETIERRADTCILLCELLFSVFNITLLECSPAVSCWGGSCAHNGTLCRYRTVQSTLFLWWATEVCWGLIISNAAVSVHLCCYNKTPVTGWFRKNRNLLLTVLEARKSRIKLWQVPGLVRAALCFRDGASFEGTRAVSPHGTRGRGAKGPNAAWSLFYRGLHPL